jgi:hypothetical protein
MWTYSAQLFINIKYTYSSINLNFIVDILEPNEINNSSFLEKNMLTT